MRKNIFFFALIAVLVVQPYQIFAQETVYPAGIAVPVFYTTDHTSVAAGDTLTITRTIKNNESYILSGLYFSENLPPDFQIISESVTRNGVPLSYISTGPLNNLIITGYNAYYWIIDSPDSSENIHNTIQPGDSIVLEIHLTCNNVGDYVFPLHTTVCYGNTTGIFAADTFGIRVELSLDVDDDFPDDGLPSGFLVSKAYPNPFNGEVTIQYSGDNVSGKPVSLEIYDILGRKVHRYGITGKEDTGQFHWVTDNSLASGVYLYIIKANNHRTTGKVMLVK